MEWINIKDKLPEDGKVYDIVIYWPETADTKARQERRNGYIFKSKHAVVDWVNYFQELPFYEMGLYEMSFGVDENLVTHYMPHVPMPPIPAMCWQYSTKQSPNEWHDATNDEYELGKDLVRFNWRQIEK